MQIMAKGLKISLCADRRDEIDNMVIRVEEEPKRDFS